MIRAKKVMTRESYRLVENFLHLYTLNIHVFPLILHSPHANMYYLTSSCLCLLLHITHKNLMVYLSISALSNLYPFITSYSCMPSFICITSLHHIRSSPYRLHSNSTCSSVSTCPHPQMYEFCHYLSPFVIICHYLSLFVIICLMHLSQLVSLRTVYIISFIHFVA